MKKRGRPKISNKLADQFTKRLNDHDELDDDWDMFYYREKLASTTYAFSLEADRCNHDLDKLAKFDSDKEAEKYYRKEMQWSVMVFIPDKVKVSTFTKRNVLVRKDEGQLFFKNNALKEDELENPRYRFYRIYHYKPTRAFFTNTYDAALFIFSLLHFQGDGRVLGEINAADIDYIKRNKTEADILNKFYEIKKTLLRQHVSDPDKEFIKEEFEKLKRRINTNNSERTKETLLMHEYMFVDLDKYGKTSIGELISEVFEELETIINSADVHEVRKQQKIIYDQIKPSTYPMLRAIRADIKKCCTGRRSSVRGFTVVPIGKYPVVKEEYRKSILIHPGDDLNWTLY